MLAAASIVALVIFALLWILSRQRATREEAEVIDDDHDTLLKAMMDWLNLPDVQAIALRDGIYADVGALNKVQNSLIAYPKIQLKRAAGHLLQSAQIRRRLAAHLNKNYGMKKAAAMALLRQIQEDSGLEFVRTA